MKSEDSDRKARANVHEKKGSLEGIKLRIGVIFVTFKTNTQRSFHMMSHLLFMLVINQQNYLGPYYVLCLLKNDQAITTQCKSYAITWNEFVPIDNANLLAGIAAETS